MIHKAAFIALLCAASFAFNGCTGEDENPAVPAPATSLTGTWDLFIENKLPEAWLWLEITDDNGVLTGNYVYATGSIPLKGTCNSAGDVSVVYEQKDPDMAMPVRGVLEGKAHADRTVISGTIRVLIPESGTVVYWGPFYACKR